MGKTQRYEVRLWKISKYSQVGKSSEIIYEFPEEYQPSFDTSNEQVDASSDSVLGRERGDITLLTLIEKNLIPVGQQLFIEYGPRGKKKQKFIATILEGGIINVLGQNFRSPSYAALACINNAGSNRNTINGWASWKLLDSQITLNDLRIKITKNSTGLENCST
ncbi:MAG TPA: hypothetical protein P5260_12600 [Candidatus Competibacter sp.]|nr:hypothetical protein [Candidatus Competibacter sp.]HRX62033.1 hypothetical protein [Candidatus Competibacter sp.]